MRKSYVITIDQEYVRDTQIAKDPEVTPTSDQWIDYQGDIYLGIWQGSTEDEAKSICANHHKLHEGILDAYPTQEDQDDVFAVIRWSVDDLKDVFRDKEVLINDRNIEMFLQSNAPSVLEDRSIEEGWDILDVLVTEVKDELDVMKDKIYTTFWLMANGLNHLIQISMMNQFVGCGKTFRKLKIL